MLISILLSLSFGLRWGYIKNTEMIEPVRADALLYTILAVNIAAEGQYITQRDPATESKLMSRDPGYSFFLASFIKHTKSMKEFFYTTGFIQSVLGTITVLTTFCLSRFFLGWGWSFFTAFLTMISPHLISMTNYVLTETVFTFFLQAALVIYCLAIKRKSAVLIAASGLCFGYAIFVRSVLMLFPFALALLTFIFSKFQRKEAVKLAVVLLASSYVFLVPWKIWSHYNLKKGPNLLMSVIYVGSYPGLVYDDSPESKVDIGMPWYHDPEFQEVIKGGYPRIVVEIVKRFKEDPGGFLLWYLVGKPAMYWSWPFVHSGGDINVYPLKHNWYDTNSVMMLTKNMMRISHPFIIVLMHAGLFLFVRKRKMFSYEQQFSMGVMAILVAYFLSIHTLTVPVPRYSLPLRPLVYFLAVFAVAQLTGIFRHEVDK